MTQQPLTPEQFVQRAVASLGVSEAEAYRRLGDALMRQGLAQDALDAYKQSLSRDPGNVAAENNLGIAYLALDRYDEALSVYQGSLFRQRGLTREQRAAFTPQPVSESPAPAFTTAFKIEDRILQLSYLIEQGHIDASFSRLVDRYRELLTQLEADTSPGPSARLTPEQVQPFGGYFDRIVHYVDAGRAGGSVVTPDNDYAGLEAAFAERPIVAFDDFLTPDALQSLRRFLTESTVYFHHSPARFVGSYMADGLSCGLLFQVAAELQRRLPNVLAGCHLTNMWAYRYDRSGVGVRPHYDDGDVTVNFWLTDDSANIGNPEAGGLVVYDRDRPVDWDWAVNVYKDDPAVQAQMAAYLADAHEAIVPYRCNRAVLFRSTLLHRTEPFEFRDGFEDRRINVTLLFVRR